MSSQDSSKKLISINSICSLLSFSGNNVIDFLNNFLISNLTVLSQNNYHYTALCNPKGRIISSMWINIINQDQVYLICPSNLRDDLVSFFNMRKFRLKINITQPQQEIIANTINLTIFTTDAADQLVKPATIENFYEFMFNQNLPWINNNYTEKFIPQHVNLDQHQNIMSFNKGCYPGQEIIARLKYLGKIKKRMVLLKNNTQELLSSQIEKMQATSPIIQINDKDMFAVQVIDKVK
ncbi:MAG: hypothetical protein JKX98_07495 [Alcanivoracaceae bacterium]|nr:hypothetical protein [Alcanivoracaceae bacterium]